MFCPDADIGYDPTIRVDTDATGKSIHYIMADRTEYRIIKLLFRGDYICGRGTTVWRAVPADCADLGDESRWVTIKDVWADIARDHTEAWFLQHARGLDVIQGIPEVIWAGTVSFGGRADSTDQHSSRHDRPTNAQPDGTLVRTHHRLVFKNCGIPITKFRNKKELLEVFIELIQGTSIYEKALVKP